MMDQRHLAELEREQLRRWLLQPEASAHFDDPANRRLVDVFSAHNLGWSSSRELAVLLREHIRRWAIQSGDPHPLTVASEMLASVDGGTLDDVGLVVVRDGDRSFLSARSWEPTWLANPLNTPIDESAASGTGRGWRRQDALLRADDAFRNATGYSTYRTPGQRDAVRMVLEMDPNGLMIANLPTGCGKTEVVITLARSFERTGGGTVVMVVPTIALAQDLEDRFQQRWSQLLSRDLSEVPFAWTNATPPDKRADMRSRLMRGQQPILVTSPESLNGALLEVTKVAAGNGRLRALVVDEAHLVTQWGRSFRPDFRLLGSLWKELNELSDSGVRAVLMSATLGPDVVEDLCAEFATDEGPWVVAANALRQEPRIWVGPFETRAVRHEHVLEALDHLPRPCILYVTQPRVARSWVARLRERGYRRVTIVTGDSSPEERSRALRGVRTSRGSSEFDIVVATSAFGLGVDADEIRCIIHACIPETADRWYQEVGRGGRDGYASTALLLPAVGDVEEARSLGVDVLNSTIAQERWAAMWVNRRSIDADFYVNLKYSPPGKQDGSYNRRWNAQTLDGLQQLGVLDRSPVSFDETLRVGLVEPDTRSRLPDSWSKIELRGHLPDQEFFNERWSEWKTLIDRSSQLAFDTMEDLIGSRDACSVIHAAYVPSDSSVSRLGADAARGFSVTYPCGRCQHCGLFDRAPMTDPAPDPTIRWPGDALADDFRNFVAANQFVLPAVGPLELVCVVECSVDELVVLAPVLASSGARLAAGAGLEATAHEFAYFDPVPNVISTLPIATVVSLRDPAELPGLLQQLRLRLVSASGRPGPVLVQVPEVPREVRAQRPTSAYDVQRGLGD